jgi:hypothetical protein
MADARRRYFLQVNFDDPLMLDEVFEHVERVCAVWRTKQWFLEIQITGRSLGFLQAQVVVRDHNQWDVHRRAMKFARALAAGARVRVTQFQEPIIERLPERRGGARVGAGRPKGAAE